MDLERNAGTEVTAGAEVDCRNIAFTLIDRIGQFSMITPTEGDAALVSWLAAKRSATTQSFATLVHTQSVELSSILQEQPLPPRDAK